MTAEKSGKDGKDGNTNSGDVGVSRYRRGTTNRRKQCWHPVTLQTSAFLPVHSFIRELRSSTLKKRDIQTAYIYVYARVCINSAYRCNPHLCNHSHVIFPGKPYRPLDITHSFSSTRSPTLTSPDRPPNGKYELLYICVSVVDTALGDSSWWMDSVWNR